MAPFFRKKSLMEKLEHELAALRARAETLHSRHAAAEAAFIDAETKLQTHLLEADLDADDKVRAKLEAAVASCALTRDSIAKAVAAQQAKVVDAEAKVAAERAAVERNAAADKLAHDLDEIDKALPDYLTAARRLADAIDQVSHFHYEANELGAVARNWAAQIDVAGALALAELRQMVEQIKTGVAPMPPGKPSPTPVVAAEPAPPTMTVFMIRSARFRDHDGRKRFAGQYEDAIMPVATAQKAMRLGVAVSTADPKRAQLRGARGGDYRADAPDVVDLDAVSEYSGAPVAEANLTVINRGVPERKGTISVYRV